jgi:hypothetical protein
MHGACFCRPGTSLIWCVSDRGTNSHGTSSQVMVQKCGSKALVQCRGTNLVEATTQVMVQKFEYWQMSVSGFGYSKYLSYRQK